MSDNREPEKRETTIIQTGDSGSGLGPALIIIVAVLLVMGGIFYWYNTAGPSTGDINVNVAAPKVELPDVQITPPASEPTKNGN